MNDPTPTIASALDLLTETHAQLVEMWQAMPNTQARDLVWRAAEQVQEARVTLRGF